MKMNYKGKEWDVEVKEEVDNLKANWGIWSCVLVRADEEIEGSVQTDGEHLLAPETFEEN